MAEAGGGDRDLRDFHDRVVAAHLLSQGEPQAQPVVILLSAQAGAGKTRLGPTLQNRLAEQGGAVAVDVDMFKTLLPGFDQMLRDHGRRAFDIAIPDARRWYDLALDHLISRRVNVIAEHGMRDRGAAESVLDRFASAEYRIEAALVAAPAAMSRLGILERYQVGLETTGIGRYISEEEHDQRYWNLSTVADLLDADPRIAGVAVYRRDGQAVHSKERVGSGVWSVSLPTRDALESERRRPWTIGESARFLRVHDSLAARMDEEWHRPLHASHREAEALLSPVAVHRTMHDATAVTFGRYQLVSVAHLDTVRTILREWPRLVVGVLDANATTGAGLAVPPHQRDFMQAADSNWAPERNPMDVDVRVALWRAALVTAGFADRVNVEPIPRPELDPNGFNLRFPSDRFHLVFPAPQDNAEGFDRSRNASLSDILDRPVHEVDPPLEHHTSDIKGAYRQGATRTWQSALAPGTLDTFVAANGPQRLLGEPSSQVEAPNQVDSEQGQNEVQPPTPKSGVDLEDYLDDQPQSADLGRQDGPELNL